ncbi:ubiquitin-like domain-containing protein [Streptomyces sp. NBC_00091]|uniref:ubiquitin-like domain-containing protein n=1 Tax=Streptomyces sp. NBC_00091 TaxID=2975648 RepID=UPI002B1D27A0|nr:ubiquitin-like domain-containing protein [Streptomyces sp. NBC_00091]
MSDTQGSHRRVSWPEAQPDPGPDPGPDPDPGRASEPGVPAPRGEGRRAARRRAAAPAETPPPPAPDPAQPGGRRRAPNRRRAAPAQPPAPIPAPIPAPAPAPDADPGSGSAGARPPGGGSGRRRRSVRNPAGPGAAARDSWRRIVPQALVVAFLAGGTTAFVAADKAVRLTVDGVPRTLHTFAGSVDELLDAEGLGVGPHDLVAPARGSVLDDGQQVVVRYGRPLRLTLDGTSRQVWTTARTVDGALRQLGVRVEGAYLSAPRTAPVPRTGLTLGVRTERGVTFMADGRERTIRTNAATVQEALDQAGITLQGQDTTSVPPDSFPRDGQTVTVLRITGTREVREERIPYETERVEDAALFAGTEVVERVGRPGARRVTYALRTVNGVRQQPRKIAEEVVREPVSQRVLVGTKPLPTSVAGADGLDWAALAQCESGGRPAATDASGTYGGLYQFDVRTWQGLGGSGRPQDAPASEQTYRAKKLYVQRGASPWPHCGRRLER